MNTLRLTTLVSISFIYIADISLNFISLRKYVFITNTVLFYVAFCLIKYEALEIKKVKLVSIIIWATILGLGIYDGVELFSRGVL